MYKIADYVNRGRLLLNNSIYPNKKKLASIMLYATDRCNARCKHCNIWEKKPKQDMSLQMIKQIVQSKAVTKNTKIGLEGGEFILHPEYTEILSYFIANHPNFDLLSNCLKPDMLISAVKKYPPKRLFISLDGQESTHNLMRGVNDLYPKVIHVIKELKEKVPISVMFTLTPFNTMTDMKHIIDISKENKIDLRIGIYSDMEYFETTEPTIGNRSSLDYEIADIPERIKDFNENYDFLALYHSYRKNHVKLTCNSIKDSVVVYPNGDIPICQYKQVILGNLMNESLESILNKESTIKFHQEHKQCNGCWINFHRKYDIVLYRNLEKIFPKKIVEIFMGRYSWDQKHTKTYSARAGCLFIALIN